MTGHIQRYTACWGARKQVLHKQGGNKHKQGGNKDVWRSIHGTKEMLLIGVGMYGMLLIVGMYGMLLIVGMYGWYALIGKR